MATRLAAITCQQRRSHDVIKLGRPTISNQRTGSGSKHDKDKDACLKHWGVWVLRLLPPTHPLPVVQVAQHMPAMFVQDESCIEQTCRHSRHRFPIMKKLLPDSRAQTV